MYSVDIPIKLPSLNDYIRACRANKFLGAQMKKEMESEIGFYIQSLPRLTSPVRITFQWTEATKRRDLDNICFAKKFILDSMVKFGKLQDDNRRMVTGFTDEFYYGDDNNVRLIIKEADDESGKTGSTSS